MLPRDAATTTPPSTPPTPPSTSPPSAEGKAGLADALLTAAETLVLIEGRENDVIAHLQQYIQISKKPLGIDVTWSRIHEMLGDAYYKNEQLQTAVAAYQAALQFNPYTPWEVSLHYRIARDASISWATTRNRCRRSRTCSKPPKPTDRPSAIIASTTSSATPTSRSAAIDDAITAYQTALQIAPANAENLDKIRQYYQFAQRIQPPGIMGYICTAVEHGVCMSENVIVIGGGLAGSEAAWQLAERGFHVDLYEMRPRKTTGAHVSDRLAELVCSNSFGSKLPDRASGLAQNRTGHAALAAARLRRTGGSPGGRRAGG